MLSGQMFLIAVVLVLTSRYFILGVEQGTHMFADVQDFAFSLHNLNETTVRSRSHASLCSINGFYFMSFSREGGGVRSPKKQ